MSSIWKCYAVDGWPIWGDMFSILHIRPESRILSRKSCLRHLTRSSGKRFPAQENDYHHPFWRFGKERVLFWRTKTLMSNQNADRRMEKTKSGGCARLWADLIFFKKKSSGKKKTLKLGLLNWLEFNKFGLFK